MFVYVDRTVTEDLEPDDRRRCAPSARNPPFGTTLLVARLRWRLEQALAAERRQVEELRQLDRLKNDFIATVSHELRTPVAAVYGAAETLRLRQLQEETREQLLGIVYSESDRLSKLTTALLDAVAL